MANDQEWNPGLQDGVGLHTADPTGYFIGPLNGQPIRCILAVRHVRHVIYGDIRVLIIIHNYYTRNFIKVNTLL